MDVLLAYIVLAGNISDLITSKISVWSNKFANLAITYILEEISQNFMQQLQFLKCFDPIFLIKTNSVIISNKFGSLLQNIQFKIQAIKSQRTKSITKHTKIFLLILKSSFNETTATRNWVVLYSDKHKNCIILHKIKINF